MTYQFLVLQHGDKQRAGRFFKAMADQLAVQLYVVDILHQPVPDFTGFDALIILSGTANGENSSRLFVEEKRILQAWISLDLPCLCLGSGHLLLAEVMGGVVGPNFIDSIGFISGHLTHDGRSHPLFAGFDTPFPLYKWHDRSIQTPVPRSIILLATSNECVVEAFCGRGRPHIIGMQFENHGAHPEDVADRIIRERKWLDRHGKAVEDVDRLIYGARQYNEEIEEKFSLMMKNFIGLLGR